VDLCALAGSISNGRTPSNPLTTKPCLAGKCYKRQDGRERRYVIYKSRHNRLKTTHVRNMPLFSCSQRGLYIHTSKVRQSQTPKRKHRNEMVGLPRQKYNSEDMAAMGEIESKIPPTSVHNPSTCETWKGLMLALPGRPPPCSTNRKPSYGAAQPGIDIYSLIP
jgi:hypothetical protein